MDTFEYFFGTSLGLLLLKHSDNLSKTLQHTFMSASEGQSVSAMTVATLKLMRSDEQFDMFWALVTARAKELDIGEPVLPRKRKRPGRYEDGQAQPYFPSTPKSLYQTVYLNALDAIIACIEARFDQPGYLILRQLESLLIKAVNKEDFSSELESVSRFYDTEIDEALLVTHLHTLSAIFNQDSTAMSMQDQPATFSDLQKFMGKLTVPQRSLISQAFFVYKMILLAPATNAVSEHSCSALRHTKTWLRTTMNQERLNHCLILHTHQPLTDDIEIQSVAEEFIECNECRIHTFGHQSSVY